MANELVDSFAAEIASNDAPPKDPPAETPAPSGDEELEESPGTEETLEETWVDATLCGNAENDRWEL